MTSTSGWLSFVALKITEDVDGKGAGLNGWGGIGSSSQLIQSLIRLVVAEDNLKSWSIESNRLKLPLQFKRRSEFEWIYQNEKLIK